MSGPVTREERRVAVVVPTWNGGARFGELLDALAGQDFDEGFRLVVVDSSSSDGTDATAEAAGALVHRIPQSEFDHGATRNVGIGLAGGELCLLLTQDAVPMDAGYVRAMVGAFDDPRVEGAYARQFPRPDCDPLLAERLRQWSAAREEPVVQCLVPGDPDASARRFDELAPLERYLASAFDNVASAVRVSAWRERPFPRANFGEDVAWGRATLLAGGALAFEPAARVEHSHRIAIRREFCRIYRDHKNLYTLFGLRNVPSWSAVFDGWRHQRGFYAQLLADQELPARERLFWRAYSVPYALAETAAQFLGVRSHWKALESPLWRWVDRRVTSD